MAAGLLVSITLAQADSMIDAALAAGQERGLKPLTVAVLDVGGHLVALKRQDGSGILRVEIAVGKAWGALGMGESSREIGERLASRQAFQGALAVAAQGRMIPVPGGVLACSQDGTVLGAVGISGDASEHDEACAMAGVRAAGLVPRPDL
jgi:uncharacterized protein GlcG (DUF336 family)